MKPISVKVVGLEELCPELMFTHFGRHVLEVFSLDRWVSLEDGLDDVVGQIVLQTIRSVSL